MDYEKRKRFIVNMIFTAIIAAIVYIGAKYGVGLVAPFLIAFMIAYILKTPARYISKKLKIPFKPVVLLLVLLFYSTIGLLITLLGMKAATTIASLVTALPSFYKHEVVPVMSMVFKSVEQTIFELDPDLIAFTSDTFTRFIQSIGEILTNMSVVVASALSGFASSIPGLFIKLVLMIISTFFIAGDYEILVGFCGRQLPDKARVLLIQIKEYVVGTLFVCIRSYAMIMSLTFVELSIGLTIIGIKNAITIAFVISIFDILPVLGTGGIMIPWMIIKALLGDYTGALGLVIIYLAITVIRNILEPKIVGGQLGLHPIVTLVSMFVGVQLVGVLGLFGFPILLSLLRHLNDNGTIKIFN